MNGLARKLLIFHFATALLPCHIEDKVYDMRALLLLRIQRGLMASKLGCSWRTCSPALNCTFRYLTRTSPLCLP